MKQQRLSASITVGSVLEKSFKKNIGFIRSGFENVGDSIRDVKKRQKELSRERADLIKQGRSVKALDREYEDLERTLDKLVDKQRRWERAMRDSARVGDSFKKMSSQIGRNARQVGAVAAAGAAGIYTIASSTAEYGDQVAKTAGKLGIGIEALQEYRYAAERSGVSIGTFDSSLTAMQKRLGEAAQGTGAAKKALDQMGLSARDLIAMGPEKAMAAIADRLNKVEQPAERAALAAALFSRSGIGMVNMLGQGSSALEQLREDARKTGYVLSEEAARDAEAFADAQLDAQLTIKGLKNTIGAELMPVVTRSMKAFSGWAVSNREDIAEFAETAAAKVEQFLPVVGELATGIGTVAGHVGSLVAKGAEMAGGWERLGVIVGGVFAAKTTMTVVNFAVSVGRLGMSLGSLAGVLPLVAKGIGAVTNLLIANPIGLAIGAIAGGTYLIYRNWETVGPWFTELWDGVKGSFSGVGQFIGSVWRGDMQAAADGANAAWAGAGNLIGTYVEEMGAVYRATWERVIKPVTDALGVTGHITAAWAYVGTFFTDLWDGVKQTFGNFGQFIGSVWRGDMQAAADGASAAWAGAGNLIGTYVEEMGAVYRATWERVIKPVTDALGVTDHITDAWESVKTSIGAVLDYLAERFENIMTALQPVLDGLSWLRDKGAGAIEGVQGIGSGIREWWSGDEDSETTEQPRNPRAGKALPPRVFGSFRGGDISRGFRTVGEQGPETIWASKGRYVAHAGATERIAQLSAKAGPMVDALGAGLARIRETARPISAPRLQVVHPPGVAAQPQIDAQLPAAAPVVIHAQINATGMNPQELIDELERRGRAAQSGALFDGAHGYGQYEGA